MNRMYLSNTEKAETRRIIREKTGYLIKSTSILNQVFRRSSFAAETGQNSNEIFEFIGDQVLSFFVVKIISKRCGSFGVTDDYTFRIRENRFTLIKQSLVNNEALATIIEEWDIARYMFFGKSDINNGVTEEQKGKADLFEAILGAIAVESNWDSDVLETAVLKALNIDETVKTMIEEDAKTRIFDINNAVTVLKEMAEKGECTMPVYKLTGPDDIDYDNDGNPKWLCTCKTINEKTELTKLVEANSKKAAKKAASYLILCELFGVQNEHGPNGSTVWKYKEKEGKLLPDCDIW